MDEANLAPQSLARLWIKLQPCAWEGENREEKKKEDEREEEEGGNAR